MKAITFSEARIGDGVRRGKEILFPVQYITPVGDKILLSGFTSAGKVELLGLPDDIIGLLHRPWPKEQTKGSMRQEIVERARRVIDIVDDTFGQAAPDHLFDPDLVISPLGQLIAEYELGKQQEVAKPEPEPENCYEGRCKHPKNFAGSCIVYLMDHPPQRDC